MKIKTDNSKVNENLLKQNAELLKQNEALVGCLKKINLLHASNKGLAEFQIEANEILNTLNKQTMIGIKCKSGHVFSACNENFIDAEWRLQEAYYKAQGCEVEINDEVRFSECNCEHCQSLEHEFENLIEEIKNDNSKRVYLRYE